MEFAQINLFTQVSTRGANLTKVSRTVVNTTSLSGKIFPFLSNHLPLPPSLPAVELNPEPGIIATFDPQPPTRQDDLVFH